MRKLVLLGLILFSMFCAGVTPAVSQTVEQSKKVQIENALKSPNGQKIKNAVTKYSAQYGLDAKLVHAVIFTESGYNPYAKSPCGAKGLMQFMEPTFKARGGNNIWDIDENIKCGCLHLAGLKAKYKGNMYLALAAYNIGGGNVDKYGITVQAKKYINKIYYHKSIIDTII